MTDKPADPKTEKAHTELRRQTKQTGKEGAKTSAAKPLKDRATPPKDKSDPLDDLFNDMPV